MILVKWTIEFAYAPDGAQQQNVPVAQTLRATNDFPVYSSATPNTGGYIVVPGGNNPSAANITTALGTLQTNANAFFTAQPNLGIIQGWQTGAG
jgi:hypothetical protein